MIFKEGNFVIHNISSQFRRKSILSFFHCEKMFLLFIDLLNFSHPPRRETILSFTVENLPVVCLLNFSQLPNRKVFILSSTVRTYFPVHIFFFNFSQLANRKAKVIHSLFHSEKFFFYCYFLKNFSRLPNRKSYSFSLTVRNFFPVVNRYNFSKAFSPMRKFSQLSL